MCIDCFKDIEVDPKAVGRYDYKVMGGQTCRGCGVHKYYFYYATPDEIQAVRERYKNHEINQ